MKNISKEDFVLRAIKNLRTDKSKGIHVVYSNFNDAFRKYFNEESNATTDAMVAKGLIETRPVEGGIMMYLKGEMPARNNDKKTATTIAKIVA